MLDSKMKNSHTGVALNLDQERVKTGLQVI